MHLERAREENGRFLPLVVLLREALELDEDVGIVRLTDDRRLDRALRARRVVRFVLANAREVEPCARATARAVGAIDAALVEAGELFAAVRRAIDAFERVERVVEERAVGEQLLDRLAGRLVLRHALERDPKRGQALRLVAERVDLERRETMMQIGLHLRFGLDPDAALEDVDERARVTELRVHTLERREHVARVAALLCRFGVGLGRAREIVELRLGDAAQAEEQVRRRVWLEDRVRALAEHGRVAVPALAAHQRRDPADVVVEILLERLIGQRPKKRPLRSRKVVQVRLGHLRDRA